MSQQWYYDPTTGTVSEGKVKGWDRRMGPYESRAAAEHALQRVAERNAVADAYDEDDDRRTAR